MAEALGVAASVSGLVSLGLQTTEYLYKYYNAYKDRDEDLSKTTRRLGDLLHSLAVIDDVLRTRTWRPNEKTTLQSIENAIHQSEDVIQDLQDEVQKLQQEPTTTGNITAAARAIGRRAAYPFRKATLAKLDEDVGAFNENLAMALQALHLKEHQNTQRDIDQVRDIVKSAQAQNLAAGVRQWLKAPDATIEYNAACMKRHAGTGLWLVQGPTFTTWLQRDNSFLWLYGFAGCGKSVLCSTAVQHAFRRQRSTPGSAIAFFFFTFNDESKRDASAFLRALLLQLSGQIPGVDAELRKLQGSYNHGTPPVSVLVEYLRQAVVRSPHVYILLDALDECPAATLRQDVLTTIRTMRQWSLPGLHLLVTSRDLPDIRAGLHFHGPVQDEESVALNRDNVQQDIQDYVAHQVDHDPHLHRWGDHREKIKDHLTRRAEGVFRWVECQLEPLRHCPRSVKHLEKRLRGLPQTLDETYERMLCDIDLDSRDEAQRLLALLCCSTRPLSVDEIIDALAVDVDGDEGFDTDRKFEGADDLLRICPGMIEISRTVLDVYYDWTLDEDNGRLNDSDSGQILDQIVRIAHFSVQEYLTSDRIRQGRAADFVVSDGREHALISRTCLLYLRNDEFLSQALSPDLVRQFPFVKFAATQWAYHYRNGDAKLVVPLSSQAVGLLTNSAMFIRWVMIANPDPSRFISISDRDSVEDRPAAIYYAALLGLDDVLLGVLSMPHNNVNARGGLYGTALQAASTLGYEKVVQILLDKGADVNAQGGFYGTALQAASVDGCEKIVQVLLDKGADVNAQKGEYGTALIAASNGGYEKIVQMLLNKGADINVENDEYGTALYIASKRGHEKVVQILLDMGADVNWQGDYYRTALTAASRSGHAKIVQILLDKGADINTQDEYHGNAVHEASGGGHEQVVQMLLDRGADVNAKGGPYGTPLQGASAYGHEQVVQILLDRGADADAQEGHNGTALQLASAHRHKQVVRILLDRGANVNAQGGSDGTALQAAVWDGSEQLVQLLLDRGADVNAKGGDFGSTALRLASMRRNEKMVQLLLRYGAKQSEDD